MFWETVVDRTLTAINFQSLFFLLLALDRPVRTSFAFGQNFWIHYIYCYIFNIKQFLYTLFIFSLQTFILYLTFSYFLLFILLFIA